MDIITKYSPDNFRELSEADIAAMSALTFEQIGSLAKAYPNKANQRAYLILKDTKKKEKDQLYPQSTWQNLYNLLKLGQKSFIAISFKETFSKKQQALKVAPVQDLTGKEVKEAMKAMKSTPVSSAQPQKAKQVDEDFEELVVPEEKAPVKKPRKSAKKDK